MWLNKIRNRMIQYHRIEEFQTDMAQIWENAMIFNEPGSQFHEWAKELKQASEELYAQRFREVEAQRAARQLAPPAETTAAYEEDAAMTPAASSTNGGDDVSYSGTSNSRPRLNLTLNASGSNSASPAPSVRGGRGGKRGGRGRGRGRGGARGSRKRILESDDDNDDPDVEEPSGDEDD